MPKIGAPFGLLREATIIKFHKERGTMIVTLNLSKSDSSIIEKEISFPGAWMGPNGEFSGGYPQLGSTIWIGQGEGGQWVPVSFAPSDDVFRNFNSLRQNSYEKNKMSALRQNRWLTQTNNNIRFFVDEDYGIQFGSPIEYIHIDPHKSISSNIFHQQYEFSAATRRVDGIVKRDLVSNSNRNITGSTLSSHVYEDALTPIGLDPLTKAGNSFVRNPPFVESRETVYEFPYDFGFTNDTDEVALYDNEEVYNSKANFDRRGSRADTLSLDLIAPNYLIESTKGTVIDIYGNILDINRNILPNGKIDKLSFRNNENNPSDTFTELRKQTRKSIAYHFEINARKQFPLQDINDSNNYGRDRGNFSLDIDKEGQFKLNVPMSSEIGNIPLPIRYSNYSTLKALADDGNPHEFVRNNDDQDVFIENFGIGAVKLEGGEESLTGFSAPIDRITGEPIKLGMPYHDVTKTILLHQMDSPLFYYKDSLLNDSTATPPIEKVVETSINVSGPNANAGGRSGSINFDGFISMGIGANTSDRQSLWLDTAGGIVANIGRDKRGVSYAATMDGDLLIQVGGFGISSDERFDHLFNEARDGTFDMRIFANNSMHIIRIDSKGIQIITPGTMDFVAEKNIRFKSVRGDIILDSESIFLHGDGKGRGRLVLRNGNSI